MDKNQKQNSAAFTKTAGQGRKQVKHKSVLEGLKDISQGTSQELVSQLFGRRPEKKYSGDLLPGEALEIEDIFSGRHQETIKLKKQLALERKLRKEEEVRTERKRKKLKLQLQAIMEEVAVLAQNTQELSEEVQVAAMQAPVEPGVYHLIFFEKLLEFIKSFRKNIEEAKVWLQTSNKRAQKKNYWARYKKHGGKFLLAADHYLSRSAG